MIRHAVIQLLLLLPLVLCMPPGDVEMNYEERCAREAIVYARIVVGEMLNKYEGDWSSFMGAPLQPLVIQDPNDYDDSLFLPNDLWIGSILPQVDNFWSMFALGQVNKTLNFIARKYYHDSMVASVTPPLAEQFVRDGGLMLTPKAIKLRFGELNTARSNKKDKNALARLLIDIYGRTNDLAIIQDAYHYNNNTANFPPVPEAEQIVQGLRVVTGTKYIWLPDEDDGLPLLERFDPRTVAAMLGQHLFYFKSMFFPHLLAQYILPTYHNERGMTVEAMAPLFHLMKASAFSDYFRYLYRALFYLDGEFKKASYQRSSNLFKITRFLKDIGFEYYGFKDCRKSNYMWDDDKYKVEEEMWSIIRVAQHWGLKWKRIAKKTQDWCQLSKRIMNGEIPEGLHPWEPVTPHDVFKVAFWNETEIVRPAYKMVDGFVVLDAVEEKRKRTRERNNERQRDRKRRKINGALNGQQGQDPMQEEASDAAPGAPACNAGGPDDLSRLSPMTRNLVHGYLRTALGLLGTDIPPLAPVLPQLRLDHPAFLAPLAMPALQQSSMTQQGPSSYIQPIQITSTSPPPPVPIQNATIIPAQTAPLQQAPSAPQQPSATQESEKKDGEPKKFTCTFKSIGTQEQQKFFRSHCMKLAKMTAENSGLEFAFLAASGKKMVFSPVPAPSRDKNKNDQNPQMPQDNPLAEMPSTDAQNQTPPAEEILERPMDTDSGEPKAVNPDTTTTP